MFRSEMREHQDRFCKERKRWNVERGFLWREWAVSFLLTPSQVGIMAVLVTNPQAKWEGLQWERPWLELCHLSLGSQCTGANAGLRKVKGENLMVKLAGEGLLSGPGRL